MAPTTIDSYRVLEEIGSGGLFSVYKAVQEPLGRTVALKVLKPTMSPGSAFAAQLEREAHVLSEMSHPNISMLYDFVRTDAKMYLALEYVDGYSLDKLLAKRGSGGGLPAEAVAAVGIEVARGLEHAHERGIVHRDVKPSNILLSKRGEVKLGDFGIAQRERMPSMDEPLGPAREPRLEEGGSFGTPAYMSPEQILGEVVDARSDVFSLGVVLYQLVCGRRPFEKEDEADRRAAAQRIRRDPAVPLHRRAPDVPRALERAIMRAIEKLPMDRYASAGALAAHLEEFLATRSRAPRAKLVVRLLAATGLVEADAATMADSGEPEKEERRSTRPALLGLAILGVLGIAGGAAIQATSHREKLVAGESPLELVPPVAGGLRVLATPWAEVWVDGQRVEVTPFARAIPLTPGTHYVTLRHPSAPEEKRVVTVQAGETVTLDVTMNVQAQQGGQAAALGSSRGGP